MVSREVDPVAVSVAAYSGHVEEYVAVHGAKMLDRVEEFVRWLPPGASVLDAGCGPGRDLARFAARGCRVRGVDLNPEFAALANSHAPTTVGDLRSVETLFSAAEFDGIWASASLVHLSEAEAASVLGQFARLLRCGGRMYACVKATGETGWLDEPDGRRWYTAWEPGGFAAAVAASGCSVDRVVRGPFVEVWATRAS
ncbi:class I SAM-dependent methyltransferase [Saccharopolyspora rosea]|uniref:Class I SAM-dependent methyltransferase n=1 Tax=Saccharopolyspora rosea TaxID=524884 RepID=A0ABW3FSX4_9PSEU|nr:class I SAM-dependent methyltransferase [Saccharopolyspora rosea]